MNKPKYRIRKFHCSFSGDDAFVLEEKRLFGWRTVDWFYSRRPCEDLLVSLTKGTVLYDSQGQRL